MIVDDEDKEAEKALLEGRQPEGAVVIPGVYAHRDKRGVLVSIDMERLERFMQSWRASGRLTRPSPHDEPIEKAIRKWLDDHGLETINQGKREKRLGGMNAWVASEVGCEPSSVSRYVSKLLKGPTQKLKMISRRF